MTCLCDNREWYALYEWHFPHILEDFRPIHPITNQMLSLVWATSQATFWVIYYHIVHLGDQMPKLHEGLAWLFPECHRFTPLIIGHHITYTHIYIYIYIYSMKDQCEAWETISQSFNLESVTYNWSKNESNKIKVTIYVLYLIGLKFGRIIFLLCFDYLDNCIKRLKEHMVSIQLVTP